jgi:hypothetical protein
VIVTIVVAKIYLPEALERGSPRELVPGSYSSSAAAQASEEYYVPMKTRKATMEM